MVHPPQDRRRATSGTWDDQIRYVVLESFNKASLRIAFPSPKETATTSLMEHPPCPPPSQAQQQQMRNAVMAAAAAAHAEAGGFYNNNSCNGGGGGDRTRLFAGGGKGPGPPQQTPLTEDMSHNVLKSH